MSGESSFLEILLSILGWMLVIVVAIVIAPAVSVLAGYFGGWILKSVFPGVGTHIVNGAAVFGVTLTLEQLPIVGAILAFVGSYFKASQTNNNKK